VSPGACLVFIYEKILPLPRIEPRFFGCVFRSLAANRLWYFGSTVKIQRPMDGLYGNFSKYYFE